VAHKAPDPGKGWRLFKADGTEDAPMDMECLDVTIRNDKWEPSSCRGMRHFQNAFSRLFYRTREGVKQGPVKEEVDKWRKLSLRMSKAKTIREARAIYEKGVEE